MQDFSLKNAIIKAYFEGDDSYIPVGELIYLHEHPLVLPNFLTEIDELVIKAGEVIERKNMTGYPVEQLVKLAVQIGTSLPTVDYNTGPELLKALRELYTLCTKLTQ